RAGALLVVVASLLLPIGPVGAAHAGGVLLAQAPNIDAQTIDSYGKVLGLGSRAPKFVAEIAVIRDAVARGDKAAVAEGIRALYAKVGHLIPTGRAMDQLVSALPPPDPARQPAPGLGPTQPSGSSQPSTSNPVAGGSGGSGPTLPLGQGAPSSASPGTPPPKPSPDPFPGPPRRGPTPPPGPGAPAPPP